jgi:hypothetical protein
MLTWPVASLGWVSHGSGGRSFSKRLNEFLKLNGDKKNQTKKQISH